MTESNTSESATAETVTGPEQPSDWRAHLKVHPAAQKATGEMNHLPYRRAFDRAAVMATAIMQFFRTAQTEEEAHQAIEDYVREEIGDVESQVAADRKSSDDS